MLCEELFYNRGQQLRKSSKKSRLIDSDRIQHKFGRRSWPRGLMDKASDFGSEDCRFESCRGRTLTCKNV
ncbi:unnamed protein product [Toxocara canis]|uniref:Uncharacterized protein n=1 Tax=Toxocara canis TaxID=6265 RepID=A0A183UT80_TOXCA|nr:unnamed protein product [Toxocara canis]